MAKLALQVVSTNDAAALNAVLVSLKAQTFTDWQLYVVDDGSNAEERVRVREAVEKSGLPYTFFRVHPTIGFASGHNFLFSRHESDYVMPVVAGIAMEADTLAKLVKFLDENTVCGAIATGSLLPMYRRSAVLAASMDGGLFDGSFVSARVDVDLIARLREVGYLVTTLEGSEVVLYAPRFSDVRDRDTWTYLAYRNRLWMLMTYRQGSGFFARLAGVIRGFLLSLAWAVRRPSFMVSALLESWYRREHLGKRRAWVRTLRARRRVSPLIVDGVPEYDIAVVTVSHNDLYPESLASLERARKATSLRVGVVVVDNKSSKFRANEILGAAVPDAHVLLREKNYGFGHSSNLGAHEVHARYYFFLNPDTILEDEKIFEKLWGFMQTHDDAGIVAPKIFYFDGRLQDTCRRFPAWYVPFVQRTGLKNTEFGKRYAADFSMMDFDHAVTREVDWVQGSALMIDAHVMRELGGFDERYFMYFEDIDLCRRVKGMGKKVYYYPKATLKHAHGKESARIQSFLLNLLQNKIARAHIFSWMKYMLKWGPR